LIPQFIPTGSASVPWTLAFSGILLALGGVWYLLVVLTVSRLGRAVSGTRVRHALETATSLALATLGIRLLLASGP
jgi:threonine/homoserine/homoserine lactone efflux protein